ncbi:MAG TPA: hypothetical protein VFP12_00920 [Allosphingosinicella sp.]|nr:hypothetical protein [Allosphingosinicella sp.]
MSEITQEQLAAVWTALNQPPRRCSGYSARQIMERIASDGWMYEFQLEDLAYDLDPRVLRHRSGLDLKALSEARGYQWSLVADRPSMRSIDTLLHRALSAADAASFLMDLERMGFGFDASPLIDRLRPAITKKRLVTNSELDLFWASKLRHKSSTTLEVRDGPWKLGEIKRGKFENGYRFEVWFNEDESVHSLTINGPKYRRRGAPVETKCGACGYTWRRGDPDSSAAHRAEHRKRMYALDPQPNPRMSEAIGSDADVELVTCASPKWKHLEIYRRASAFRRELGFDFVQWQSPEGDPDPHVQGFLLANDEGVILGAAAFRLREPDDTTDPPFWGLQWVWVCPSARRSGLLSTRWAMFRQRFGNFFVEGPVSESMQGFLAKQGDSELMRWPSERTKPESEEVDA